MSARTRCAVVALILAVVVAVPKSDGAFFRPGGIPPSPVFLLSDSGIPLLNDAGTQHLLPQ